MNLKKVVQESEFEIIVILGGMQGCFQTDLGSDLFESNLKQNSPSLQNLKKKNKQKKKPYLWNSM